MPHTAENFLRFHEQHQQYDDGVLWFQRYQKDLEETLTPDNPLAVQERLLLAEFCLDHANEFGEDVTKEDIEIAVQDARDALQTIDSLRNTISDWSYSNIQNTAERIQQKIITYEQKSTEGHH